MQQDTPQATPPVSQPSQPAPTPPVSGPQPGPSAPSPQGSPDNQPQSFYTPAQSPTYATHPDDHLTPLPDTTDDQPSTVAWDASEYIHTTKGVGWIIGFLLVVAALIAVAVWLNAWTFVAIILVMAFTMGFFAFRPPRTVHYELAEDGMRVGEKMYPYSDFRYFGVYQEGAFYVMTLIPVQRFHLPLNIYFAEADGENIVDIMGDHLPMQDIKPDMFDTLMRRLRF